MNTRRELLVVLLLAALLPAIFFAGPIAQFADYHDLADQRPIFGIPHFWNIVSNLAFLVVGVMGLRLLLQKKQEATAAWATLFGGAVMVAFGSSWYHADPNNATLIWDRVPIGFAFMGFLTALLVEHLQGATRRYAGYLLFPLAVFSAVAIWWWYSTGDLSLWVWVQVAPMLAVVLVLALLPGRYTHRRYLGYALACYAASKFLELGDARVMEWTGGIVSGHVLKHLAAALGVWFFYVMLRERGTLKPPGGQAAAAAGRGATPTRSRPSRLAR